MKKVTYEEKITTLDRYIAHPQAVGDPEVLQAVKLDVVKATSPSRPSLKGEGQSNAPYNTCMGLYRAFLKTRGLHLDMTGRKAALNAQAMKGIITYMTNFAKSNDKPHDGENIVKGVDFMFTHWNRLNDFMRNRVGLPDIYKNIEEILLKIRDGADKKSAAKHERERYKESLGG